MKAEKINITIILLFLFAVLFVPFFSLANGGDLHTIDEKYSVNFARAPFTPFAGQEASFLVSFFDINKNFLIQEDIIVNLFITKQGEDEFIYKDEDNMVKGGVADYKVNFSEEGLYDVFYEFHFVENPDKVYTVPEFKLDVRPTEVSQNFNTNQFFIFMGSVILSLLVGWGIGTYQRQASTSK